MHETHRMLGREKELDLEREARRRDLAAVVQAKRGRAKGQVEPGRPKWALLVPGRVAAFR